MEFNITSYTFFSFVMVLFFPSLIFAPWTENNRPKSAPLSHQLTCPGWIEFDGFTLTNYPENIDRAKRRNIMFDHEATNIMFDHEATTFAAMYAFHIGGLVPPVKILPEEFCYSFDTSPISIMKLQDDYKTCPGWILLYGFLEFDNIASTSHQDDNIASTSHQDDNIASTSHQDIKYNIGYARNQNSDNMKATSIYVYSYYDYLTRRGTRPPLKPSEFCAELGIDVLDDALKPFINTYGPDLTCKAWIELYGFNDNVEHNAQRVKHVELRKNNNNYKIMHELPLEYARRLLVLKRSDDNWRLLTPFNFCIRFVNTDESKKFTFDYKYKKPIWVRN